MILASRGSVLAVVMCLVCTSAVRSAAEGQPVRQMPTAKQPQIVIDGQGFIGTPIEAITVGAQGDMVAAGADKVVRMWRRTGGSWGLIATLRGYQEPMGYETGKVHALRFSPDDRYLLVGVADNSLGGATRVFDPRKPERMHGIIPGHLACTRGITFSKSGRHLATWSCDGQVIAYTWDNATGSAKEVFRANYLEPVGFDPEEASTKVELPYCFGFLDEDLLVLRTKLDQRYKYPHVYSLRTGKELAPVNYPAKLKDIAAAIRAIKPPASRGTHVQTCDPFLDFNADRQAGTVPWFAFGGLSREGDGQATYYAAAVLGGAARVVTYPQHSLEPVALACAANTDVVASTDVLGHIHLWRAGDGRQLAVLRPQARPIWNLRWTDDTRFTFGDRFYRQDEGYQFNNRGPLTHLLDLERMAVLPLPDAASGRQSPPSVGDPSLITSGIDRRQALSMKRGVPEEAAASREAARTFFLNFDDGRATSILAGYPEDDGSSTVEPLAPPNFQVPDEALASVWSYAFVDYPGVPRGRARCLIGTQAGELYECEIVGGGKNGHLLRVCKEYIGHSTAITSIAVSPDRTKFATSSLDGTVRVWRLKTPRILADIPTTRRSKDSCLACGGGAGAGFVAQTVYYRFDGLPFFERYRPILQQKYKPGDTVTVGTVRLKLDDKQQFALQFEEAEQKLEPSRDLAEPILNLYFAKDEQWVAWTQEGFFTSSYSGADHIGFHVNREREDLAEFYQSSVFANAFERPGLVLGTLRDMERASVPAPSFEVSTLSSPRHQIVNLVVHERRDFTRPPLARIVAPARDAVLEPGTACQVQIEIDYHPDLPLRGVAMQINDTSKRMVTQRTSVGDAGDGLRRETYQTTVDLTPGQNTLAAIAVHDSGQSRSDPVMVEVRDTAGRPQEKPRLFVLAIGISAYADPVLRLQHAHQDAERFAESMLRQKGSCFADVEVRTITDARASASGIEDALEWMRHACAGPGDVALLLISGQGLLDEDGNWYFAPSDARGDRISRTGISQAVFEKYLRPIRRLLVFSDTSRSVAGDTGAADIRQVSPFRASGCAFFNACAMGNASQELAEAGLGAFTRAIVECMRNRGADANRDGLVQVREVRAFVERQVSESTGGRQIPVFEAPAVTEDLVLGQYLD